MAEEIVPSPRFQDPDNGLSETDPVERWLNLTSRGAYPDTGSIVMLVFTSGTVPADACLFIKDQTWFVASAG
ncbi:MAG: hypothetical protein BWY05_01560 [Euryarchaeota archaeon ADurb.Bin165]|nr:MAG: hypothetical protein BWY05_01560 [Euryarchaeota archaeon ADurb.Bin165]